MSDDYFDRVGPVQGKQPIDRLEAHGQPPRSPPRSISVVGTVIAVHQSAPRHAGETHMLDVTVGAENYTELVVRVPQGAYRNWEGKHAILYLDE